MGFSRKLFILALVLGTLSISASAQQALSSWDNVENLKHDTKIVVLTKNGREYVGTKRQSTGDTLFMEARFPVQGIRTISLTKDEIAEVRTMKSRWFYSLVGMGIGLAVGIAIGSTADHPYSDDPGLGKTVGGVMGGAMGLGAGSIFAHKPKIKTVYVAP